MEKGYKFKYGSSKKASEAINRFNYHIENTVPSFSERNSNEQENSFGTFKSSQGKNNLVYFYNRQHQDGQTLVDELSIIHSVKATHLAPNMANEEIFKVNERSYQKDSTLWDGFMGLIGSQWIASEVIQFVLLPGKSEGIQKLLFELFVIHHCQNEIPQKRGKHLKWLHFVEKYSFYKDGITFETVSVLQQDQSYFNFSQNQKAFVKFASKYLKFDKFQGVLMQYQDQIRNKIKMSEDPAFSEQHNLVRQIPSQFLKMFYTLKKEFGAQNEQLICRFMIARQFNMTETRKSLNEYIEWKKEMQKYKWEDFEEFHKMNIFYYLGEDHKGRPVILNIAKNVLVDKMDGDKYCQYYMYYLEIYMPQKMRGNVTQLNILADVEGIGKENFKFAITKQNIEDGKKYCVERQYKFFAVNISSFAYFCYKFIKPLLPKKTQQKVYIGGNDRKEILQNLLKDMSQEVIPTYLGGKNPLI